MVHVSQVSLILIEMFSESHSSFFVLPSKSKDMKTILVIIVFFAVTGLNQAIQESKYENQELKNLQSLVGLVGWLVGQSYIETLSETKPKSLMNKNSRLNLPRPQSFYPIRIRNQKIKEKWDDFEYYKGLGPVTSRPFTYLDLRIIG